MFKFPLSTVLILACAIANGVDHTAVDYNEDIQPLFTKYCVTCHNADDAEGNLNLETYAGLMQGAKTGGVITTGRADLSRLYRLTSGAAKPSMPPQGNKRLTMEERGILKNWINQGAAGPRGTVRPLMLVAPEISVDHKKQPRIFSLQPSPDGKMLAIGRQKRVDIRFPNSADGNLVLAGATGAVNDLCFSKNQQFLIGGGGEPGLYGELYVWNMLDGTLVKKMRGHRDSVYAVAMSPDGKLIASAGYDRVIVIWDAKTGERIRAIQGHNGAVYDLVFFQNGKRLASASADRTVKIWDVATGERFNTLKESQQELYALSVHPNGRSLAAAGVDHRIRIWSLESVDRSVKNPLITTVYAHDNAIVDLEYSEDGSILYSASQNRVRSWSTVNWDADSEFMLEGGWVTAMANSPKRGLFVGQMDGVVTEIAQTKSMVSENLRGARVPEVMQALDYGEVVETGDLPLVTENEPNDVAASSTVMQVPGRAKGILVPAEGAASDQDLFRFQCKQGDQWVIEVHTPGEMNPLDSKVEILNLQGQSVERLLLRAIRNSEIEFRNVASAQHGFRFSNYEETYLNELLYVNGEVLKHYRQRRGPDSDSLFYPEVGPRLGLFDTTPRSHPNGQPAYIVVPYKSGTQFPQNGLPVFPLYFENDDASDGKRGTDSTLHFQAPEKGQYVVRVSDVKGASGGSFQYELVIRRPSPDVSLSVTGKNPVISPGNGKSFVVEVQRKDQFMGAVTVEIDDIPAGFTVSSPLVIQSGLNKAWGVLHAHADAPPPEDRDWGKITATTHIVGKDVVIDGGWLGKIKLADKPKLIASLSADPHSELRVTRYAERPVPEPEAPLPMAEVAEMTIVAGKTAECRLSVQRMGQQARITFEVLNLPHGVIVNDIGLSGVLIPEGQHQRRIFLTAEPWVPPQQRLFFAEARIDGNHCSLPVLLKVIRANE
ncbi:MAG: c-type cytochrome domain-containing protein [Planctomycetota bacterium]|nr:c-type cytochrome domain-containing protein [Planctomycetota bacterium]